MQILTKREYTLKIQEIRVSDETVVVVVRGVEREGIPMSTCPKHLAAVDCEHLQEASQFLHLMGF